MLHVIMVPLSVTPSTQVYTTFVLQYTDFICTCSYGKLVVGAARASRSHQLLLLAECLLRHFLDQVVRVVGSGAVSRGAVLCV